MDACEADEKPETHHVPGLCILLDVHHRLLLLLLELLSFPFKLPLSLLKGTLMLTKTLGRGRSPAEEGVL